MQEYKYHASMHGRLVVLPIAIAADMSFQRWATVPSER